LHQSFPSQASIRTASAHFTKSAPSNACPYLCSIANTRGYLTCPWQYDHPARYSITHNHPAGWHSDGPSNPSLRLNPWPQLHLCPRARRPDSTPLLLLVQVRMAKDKRRAVFLPSPSAVRPILFTLSSSSEADIALTSHAQYTYFPVSTSFFAVAECTPGLTYTQSHSHLVLDDPWRIRLTQRPSPAATQCRCSHRPHYGRLRANDRA
jgi:hypothetical protein